MAVVIGRPILLFSIEFGSVGCLSGFGLTFVRFAVQARRFNVFYIFTF